MEEELRDAPDFVKNLYNEVKSGLVEIVRIGEETETLAETYISEKVVGQTSFADCIHIATATIHKADILASWNFKHIVNVDRIRGYNSINFRLGYPMLEIRTPKEIMRYDRD